MVIVEMKNANGTILIDPSKKIEDWKMFCEGMDQDRSYFVLEYFRNSDMTAGTGSYIFIMEQENGKVLLVKNANMLLII